jgi:imidazolonepropionase
MLVRGRHIEAVGRRREIESLISADCEVIDAGHRVVLPGFIDAHTHPVFAGTRANEFEQRAVAQLIGRLPRVVAAFDPPFAQRTMPRRRI